MSAAKSNGHGSVVPDLNKLTSTTAQPTDGGKLIVLTAPLTESIDHAGYFIQMAMASLPIWLEWILNNKYPQWRNLEYNEDGSARYMPAGVRCSRLHCSASSSKTKSLRAFPMIWRNSWARERASSPFPRTTLWA